MIRHRVHFVINADELSRPVSFRTDVFLTERNFERAYEMAEKFVQDQLGDVKFLSSNADAVELREYAPELADTPAPYPLDEMDPDGDPGND